MLHHCNLCSGPGVNAQTDPFVPSFNVSYSECQNVTGAEDEESRGCYHTGDLRRQKCSILHGAAGRQSLFCILGIS